MSSEEFQLFARYESNKGTARVLDELPPQNINMLTYRIKKGQPAIQHNIPAPVKVQLGFIIEECR